MNKKHFYTAVILLSFLAVGIQPAVAVINIPGNTDYYTMGGTHKYILNQDVSDTIILSNPNIDLSLGGSGGVETDRIIFDGGGHTISTPVTFPNYGISFNQSDTSKNGYITIQNLNITDCDVGINIQNATRIDVIDIDISFCHYGINIAISGTCNVTDNNISNCSEYGIWLVSAVKNTIYNNNFFNKPDFQVILLPGTDPVSRGNVFDGNYWDDWDGDIPYTFDGGEDANPLVNPLPLSPQAKIVLLIDFVIDLDLQNGIEMSLDAKLDAVLNALDDLNENNNGAAINSLYAFINAVEAQSGNKIPVEIADELIADAQYIIDLILAE